MKKLITLLLIIASFGCSNQKQVDPVLFNYESYESTNSRLISELMDSIDNEINLLIPKMELICNERGHIYEFCETELSRLNDAKYFNNRISSWRRLSSLDILMPQTTLIDYDGYSVIETKTVKSSKCYRCGYIKENITVTFDTIYTKSVTIKNLNTLNK